MDNTAKNLTVLAWRDYEFLETLTSEQKNAIPQSPAGALNLAAKLQGSEIVQYSTYISDTCDTYISGCCSTYISNTCDTYISGCCN